MTAQNFFAHLKQVRESFFRVSPFKKIQLLFVFATAMAVVTISLWSIVAILKLNHAGRAKVAKEVPAAAPSAAESKSEEREPASTEEKKEGAPKAAVTTYQLKDISLSFTDERTGKIGYAQFTLSLGLANSDAEAWVAMNRAKLLDSLHETALNFQLQEFEGPDGIEKFKSSLKSEWSARFGKTAPVEVNFEDWTMN